MSKTPLRVLLVEDSQTDAALVLRELERGGFAVEYSRVDTGPALLAAIESQTWDVILSDFSMPEFNGLAAFEALMEKGLDIPFIFVSGRIGEERAAEAMRRGAKDYILKDNLNRLVPAVERELKEAEERRKRQAMADALRESDEKLRANERVLQTVFDTIPVGLVVKDAETRYLKVNRAWCERYGLTPEQVIGKKVQEIASRPEADRQNTLDHDRQTLTSGGRLVAAEGWETCATAENRYYQSFRAPLRDETGAIIGLVGATVDLTELKRAEEALRETNVELESANEQLRAAHLSLEAEIAERTLAEQRFRQLVELAPHALVAIDPQRRIVLVNAQTLAWFGYEREELIGQPIEILIPERFRPVHPAHVGEFFRDPALRSMGLDREVYGLRKDGSEFPVDISLSPIETAEGLRAIASIVDMTAAKRAEAEIRTSQQLLQTVFDTIPHMLIVKDAQSRILKVNRAWSDTFGIAPEQIADQDTLDLPFIPEAEKRRYIEEDRHVFAGKVYEPGERLFTVKSGQQVPFLSYKAPIYDDTGTITGLVGAFVDISDRVRAEGELRASQRLLQTVFDTIPHMLVVKDKQGRYMMVNRAWSDTYGISPDEVLHKHSIDLAQRPKSELEGIAAEDQRVLAGPGTIVTAERGLTDQFGKKRELQSIKAPLRDDRGQVAGLVAVLVDMTAEKEAQRNAALAHTRLVDAIESLPAAFLMYDPHEKLLLWNKRVGEFFPKVSARLREGMSFEEVLRIVAETKIGEADVRGDAWVSQQLDLFRNHPGRHEQELAAGQWAQVIDQRTSDGGSISLVFDVTEAKRQEEILRQSQKLEAIGSLAGGISHDFNNLLTVICSHAEFILEAAGGPGQLRDDAQMILDAGARAAALTRQLLAFSRKQVLQLRVLDINAIVANLEKMLTRLIGEDIELRATLEPTLGKINADPTQIEQIVMNLVVNARDAMPTGGKLLIETGNQSLDAAYATTHPDIRPGEYVMLAVTDTGHGMDPATQARIFEPFFTTKPQGKGTGMGLATVYGIVKQMNGSVFVYSEVGKGTSFKIYFPVSDADAALAKAAKAPSQRRRATETVLLVEDEGQVRASAARILESAGYTILQASGADEALKIAAAHGGKIDLLLSDVVMPGLSGRELWDRMRQRMPIRVLFMSGYTDDSIVRHGILEGNIPFLNKPFTRLSLLNKVRDVLDQPVPTGTAAP